MTRIWGKASQIVQKINTMFYVTKYEYCQVKNQNTYYLENKSGKITT